MLIPKERLKNQLLRNFFVDYTAKVSRYAVAFISNISYFINEGKPTENEASVQSEKDQETISLKEPDHKIEK